MHITLRSQMIAGATAVVGASAIALTPLAPAVNVPALSTVKIEAALAAYANPITAGFQTLGLGANYLFKGGYSLVNPSQNWPASGTPTYPAGIGLTLNGALATDALGGYSNVGLLNQIIADKLPALTQLVINGIDYIYNTVKAVGIAGVAIGDIIWSIPATTIAVITDLLTLQFGQAITDIQTAIVNAFANVQLAGTTMLKAGGYVLTGVVTRASAVGAALIAELPVLLGAPIAQATQLFTKVVAAGSAILQSLTTLNPQTIWNTAVAQLLSPVGIPGTILNLTLGAGLQTGPIAFPPGPNTPTEIANNFVPSTRTVVQAGVRALTNALKTPNPAPPAASAPAPAASAVRAEVAAAPAAVEAAPAADATAGDAPNASSVRSAGAEADTAAPADDSSAQAGKGAANSGGRG